MLFQYCDKNEPTKYKLGGDLYILKVTQVISAEYRTCGVGLKTDIVSHLHQRSLHGSSGDIPIISPKPSQCCWSAKVSQKSGQSPPGVEDPSNRRLAVPPSCSSGLGSASHHSLILHLLLDIKLGTASLGMNQQRNSPLSLLKTGKRF